jgi:uncharacterized protein
MNETESIQKTANHIKDKLSNDSSGHDWWHTYRVWKLGKKIAELEGANVQVVELACLLQDIADYKLNNGDEEIGPRLANEHMESLSIEPQVRDHVIKIISSSSFKGANSNSQMETLEGQCMQDADRLDAMGAIGIARCFAFGGYKGNLIYDPSIKIKINMSKEEYKRANHTQINHFHEKLLLLKGRMNTQTARKMAEERHQFMESFIQQFLKEWKETD